MAAPTVTSVTPSTGGTIGGTTVLIVGTGFTNTSTVTIGGVSADCEYSSSTLLAATTPPNVSGALTVAVTNADGTSTDAVTFTYSSSGIFTVAEARAYSKTKLESTAVYSNAVITAKEAAIRAKFERIIGVALTATASTEYYDGDGTATLYLAHHNPWAEATPRSVSVPSVTVISIDGTETAFTATELSDLVCYPHKLVRRSGAFATGSRNVRVVYTHGYSTVPEDIKQAAMEVLTMQPPDGLVPTNVTSYATDGSDGTVNWSRVKDAARSRWFGNEMVDSVLREHRDLETLPGIA